MTKYRESVVSNICKLIAKGVNQKTAAICSGITKKTFYVWIKEKSAFCDRIEKAHNSALQVAENALYMKGTGQISRKETLHRGGELIETKTRKYAPDVGALALWLCNKYPELWENIQKKIHSGEIRILTAADIDSAIKDKQKEEKEKDGTKD